MTDKIIVYRNADGSISTVYPNLGCGLSLAQIAEKDTPEGAPFVFVNKSDVPSDHTFFDAWEVDFSSPDGHGVGHKVWYGRLGVEI